MRNVDKEIERDKMQSSINDCNQKIHDFISDKVRIKLNLFTGIPIPIGIFITIMVYYIQELYMATDGFAIDLITFMENPIEVPVFENCIKTLFLNFAFIGIVIPVAISYFFKLHGKKIMNDPKMYAKLEKKLGKKYPELARIIEKKKDAQISLDCLNRELEDKSVEVTQFTKITPSREYDYGIKKTKPYGLTKLKFIYFKR